MQNTKIKKYKIQNKEGRSRKKTTKKNIRSKNSNVSSMKMIPNQTNKSTKGIYGMRGGFIASKMLKDQMNFSNKKFRKRRVFQGI